MLTPEQIESLNKTGAASYAALVELVDALSTADDTAREEAEQRIQEDALSVEVRSGWQTPGDRGVFAEEFKILLSTGGPAAQIVGELDEYGEPTSARLEVQDWFLPWTEYREADEEVLLTYCRCFYFGE